MTGQTEIINIAELRKKSLTMLKDVKEALDSEGVNYWLDFGTLLGAVRNGRAIPWDGDFDLSTLEHDIIEKTGLWDKLKQKGYNIQIAYSNITITKKDWETGWYKTDLHRYRLNNDGYAEYLYGYRHISKTARYIKRFFDAVSISISPHYTGFKNYFTPFDSICHLMLSAGNIPNEEIETIGDIRYFHGSLNSSQHFSLEHEKFSLSQNPLKQESQFFLIISKIFSLSPDGISKTCLNLCKAILQKFKREPLVHVRFSHVFFKNLSSVSFHGMIFKTPDPVEDYLELIYGKNWKTPRVKWKLSTDSTLNKSR